MRSRGLSFADAVKLLDGDSSLVAALGQAAGAGVAGLAGFPQPTWSFAVSEPVRRRLASRQAAFSANLAALAVLLSDRPVDAAELVGDRACLGERGSSGVDEQTRGAVSAEMRRRLAIFEANRRLLPAGHAGGLGAEADGNGPEAATE